MTTATPAAGSMDLQALVDQALAHFQSQEFRECLAVLDTIFATGAQTRGLHFLAAVSALAQKKLDRVLPELSIELRDPSCAPDAKQLYETIRSQYEMNPTLRTELAPDANYLICGMRPHSGGTGAFFAALLPYAEKAGFRTIYPVMDLPSEAEQIRIASIRNSRVLVLHPQTLGYDCFRALYEAGNKITMYVLDNSFFCLQSYNHRAGKRGECFDCLGNLSGCHPACSPFPVSIARKDNLTFLHWLQGVSHNIEFLCQTHHQAALLAAHMGSGIRCKVVGMKTDEFQDTPLSSHNPTPSTRRFDVVFHGHAFGAKGIRYVLELAAQLPELSFLVPSDLGEVQRCAPELPITPNVTCQRMSWTSGLKEYVSACRLVLCPSEWSAPVEGAVLKSLEFNGSVAVVETKYGFEREIPADIALKLPLHAADGAHRVRTHLKTPHPDGYRAAREWASRYRHSTDLTRIFESISRGSEP
jgi:hypothetical protein